MAQQMMGVMMSSWKSHQNNKVLIIDDSEPVRNNIKVYLEDSGFAVVEAKDGREGLKVFRDEHPAVVLTELKIPEISGLEVLDTIVNESPDTPVIIISGAGGVQEVITALRKGAWNYITKPIVDLPVLEQAICKSLERGRLIQENKEYRIKLEMLNEQLTKNLAILREDQQAGRNVQLRLLPNPHTEHDSYTFQHCFLPSLYLSGDFLDHFVVNSRKVVCYLADVSGHGSSSAFVTVLLKTLVDQNKDIVLEPDKMLATLSREIYSAKLGKYLTMIYGVIDLQDHSFTYSIGGHYPNPLLINGNKTTYLSGGGYPVGIMPHATYDTYKVVIPPQSFLTLFSDGVMEILPGDNLASKEKKLQQIVLNSNGQPQAILQGLELIKPRDLPDDITLLVVGRTT